MEHGSALPAEHLHQPLHDSSRRATTEEFKQEVYMYEFWRPGMELAVLHVRRKDLPSYVQQLPSTGHELKRKRADDDSCSSSSASDDSESSSRSRDIKRAAEAGRIRSSSEGKTQSCFLPSDVLLSS